MCLFIVVVCVFVSVFVCVLAGLSLNLFVCICCFVHWDVAVNVSTLVRTLACCFVPMLLLIEMLSAVVSGLLIAWLLGCLVAWLVGCLLACLVAWLVN